MDLWYIYSLVIVSVVVPAVTKLLENVFRLLTRLIFHVRLVEDYDHRKAINEYLKKNGHCETRTLKFNTPAIGLHFVKIDGYWLFIKNESPLRMLCYTFSKKAIESLEKKVLSSKETTIEKCFTYLHGNEVRSRYHMYKRIGPPRKWQEEIVGKIAAHFYEHETTTVLISGPPGIGKSTVGEFLVYKLREKELRPSYICNFNPTIPDLQLDEVIPYQPDKEMPIVLCMDEYDIAVGIAVNAEKTNKLIDRHSMSYASSKTELCGLMDRLSRSYNFITVATTNKDISKPSEEMPIAYTREGRFHLKFQIYETSKGKFNIKHIA